MSDSVRPHRRQPPRLPHPWDSPGKNTGVGCHFLLQCMKVKSESEVAQSCPTLSDPMDRSPPGSSVHGIFQARVLEWCAFAFSALNPSVSKSCCKHFMEVALVQADFQLKRRNIPTLFYRIHRPLGQLLVPFPFSIQILLVTRMQLMVR